MMELSMQELRELMSESTSSAATDLGARIIVCQQGWVVAGLVCQRGNEFVISEGVIVRRWGTTAGLGELAANGPLEDTKLDPAGVVRVHQLSVVLQLDCNPERWSQIWPVQQS
jgi:hypothetical protein